MSYGRAGPPDTTGMVSLKVDNLTYRTTVDDLKRLFERYGDIGDVYIPRDRYNRESRGFAFVRYYDRHDAEDAMDRLDGYLLDGRELRVSLAKYGRPQENRRRPPPHRGSNYRSRSYSRSRSRSKERRNRSGSRSRSRSPRSQSKSPRNPPKSRSRSRSRS